MLRTSDVDSGQMMSSPIDAKNIILLIVFFAALLVGAYLLTKFVNRRAMQRGMKKPAGKKGGSNSRKAPEIGKMLSVMDRIAIDRDKTLMVVHFQEKYYFLSTTAQEIRVIDKVTVPPEERNVDGDEAEETAEKDPAASYDVNDSDFFSTLGSLLKEKFGAAGAKISAFFSRVFRRNKKTKVSFEQELKQKLEEEKAQADGTEDAGEK